MMLTINIALYQDFSGQSSFFLAFLRPSARKSLVFSVFLRYNDFMKKMLIFCLSSIIIFSGLAFAAPEPSIIDKPGDWTLDARYDQPQQIVLDGAPNKRFWYIILTLTNKSGKDVDFYPECTLVTDTLATVPAEKGVSEALFDRLKTRHKSKYPFLELLENAGNKILQGADNAKDIVIIWPDFDPNAKSVDIFIAGLSNQTVAVEHPSQKDTDGKPIKVYLRKTLQLTYSISGDPAFRSDQKLKFVDKHWVMR